MTRGLRASVGETLNDAPAAFPSLHSGFLAFSNYAEGNDLTE